MRTRLTMTVACAVLAITALPAPAAAHNQSGRGPGCHSKSCETRVAERRARKACWRGDVQGCIRRAAIHWRVSYWLMDRIIGCESSHQPRQITGPFGASGLGQFLPGTWRENRYGRHDVLSAKWNSLGMAWLMRSGLAPWFASRHCWGLV